MTIRRHVQPQTLALLALLMALLLRAGIPAGYMLAPVDGAPRIVPCSGYAPVMPHHEGHHHAPGSEVPCAFAMAAPPALPDASPVLLPPMVVPPSGPALAADVAAPRPRAALPPPAIGPPSA